ncbi:DUF2934 domain-containing protein [Rhizobium sullae]|uniref:DUF2934 family protein n=1 Tax=Rhizobium sullae TaxID=50338 RepID=A0A4R3PXL1_RHISU|nr:DUF2934 domain-containing protein [Rhizobium sullae]TCU09618.1 DUF2934 family protein [Rhizobium sullae]
MVTANKRNEDPVEGSAETIERELERRNDTGTKSPDRSPGDREDRIRRRAYEKWEREGRPEGEHERHWQQAEKEIEGEDGTGRSGEHLPAPRPPTE